MQFKTLVIMLILLSFPFFTSSTLGHKIRTKEHKQDFFGKNKKSFNPEIHVFIHVCTLNQWQDILGRQLSRIKNSGLYEACQSISLGILGTEDITPFQELYPKLTILFQDSNPLLFERPTLIKLHEFCTLNPTNHVVLYIHTKGIKHFGNSIVCSNVNDWTQLMEYFNIDRWKDCVRALKNHDACGVNWNAGFYPPFFIGNFWWATSKYISTLPGQINDDYLAPELWIGSNFPTVKCFHQSNVNHYAEPYPESKYINQNP